MHSSMVIHLDLFTLIDPWKSFLNYNNISLDFCTEHDKRSYVDLLQLVVVVLVKEFPKEEQTRPSRLSINDIVSAFVKKELESVSPTSLTRNVASRGFVLNNNSEVIPYYVNTTLSMFYSEDWYLIHTRIGDIFMRYLLQDCYLFLGIGNGNYLQLSGMELCWTKDLDIINVFSNNRRYLKTKALDAQSYVYKLYVKYQYIYRKRIEHSSVETSNQSSVRISNQSKKRKAQNEIDVLDLKMRKRVCIRDYFHPQEESSKQPKKKRLSIWRRRKKNKPMCIESPSQNEHTSHKEKSKLKVTQTTNAKKCVSFTIIKRYSIFCSLPYSEAEGASKKSSLWHTTQADGSKLTRIILGVNEKSKLSQRHYQFLDIVQSIIARNDKLPITNILHRFCPIKKYTHHTDVNPTFSNTYGQVSRFIISSCKTILPFRALGSKHNWRILEKYIKLFIRMRKSEKISTRNLLEHFVLKDIGWLNSKGRKTPSDHIKKTQIFVNFLKWLFDDFICSTLSNNFYVTETAKGNSIVYYRRKVWSIIYDRTITSLMKRKLIQPIQNNEAYSILERRDLGVASCRLIPRKKQLRFIVNMGRKYRNPQSKIEYKSINSVLKEIKCVLDYEISHQKKSLIGFSVSKSDEIYSQVLGFKRKLNGTGKKLYFVKSDISSAYDSILHDKLFEILNETFKLEKYLLLSYNKTRVDNGNCFYQWVRYVLHPSDFPQFKDIAAKLSFTLNNTILTDNVRYKYISREFVYTTIKHHVCANLITSGSQFFKQTRGIPQGSVISSHLCSLYYGHMENKYLKHLTDGNESLLLRWVDDFLYITTNEHNARQFASIMMNGIHEYGFKCSLDKTIVNFPMIHEGSVISEVNHFNLIKWCGWIIHTETLEISRSHLSNIIRLNLNQSYSSHPGIALYFKIFRYMQMNLHAMLFDGRINSQNTIYINISGLFLNCAHRFMYHEVDLAGIGIYKKRPNFTFIMNLVLNSISYFCSILEKFEATYLFEKVVKHEEIEYLGLKSYLLIFRKESERYGYILNKINRHLHVMISELKSLNVPLLTSSIAISARRL